MANIDNKRNKPLSLSLSLSLFAQTFKKMAPLNFCEISSAWRPVVTPPAQQVKQNTKKNKLYEHKPKVVQTVTNQYVTNKLSPQVQFKTTS